MARIRCHYADCVFLDEGYCSAAAIELDPDTGCATYTPTEAASKEGWGRRKRLMNGRMTIPRTMKKRLGTRTKTSSSPPGELSQR